MEETIKIAVAGRTYSIRCADKAKQELYRLAEKRVNDKILSYQQRNIKGLTNDDLIALMIFDDEVEAIKRRQNNFAGSEEREKLQKIEETIEEYLNDLSLEKGVK